VERPVSFDSDGRRLYGILGCPDTIGRALRDPVTAGAPSAPRAARGVVLIHGWSGYRIGPNRIFVDASRAFNAAGVATLRFDLRGRGDSEGDTFETDLDAMISDACAAVECLRRESRADDIALLGICSGSNVAIGAATLMSQIRELILWSIFTFAPQKKRSDRIRRTCRFALDYARKLVRAETWRKLFTGRINFGMVGKVLFGSRPAGTKEGRNPKDSRRDIMAAFAGYGGRALFIHGSRDAEAHGAREVFHNFCTGHGIRSEFILVDGASHNFQSARWKSEVIARSIAWLLAENSSGDPSASAQGRPEHRRTGERTPR